MWIKKTEEEIHAVHHHMQTSPGIPLLLASCAAALSVTMSNEPSVLFAVGMFLFTFVITYVSQQLSGGAFRLTFVGDFVTQSRDDPVICVACHAVQNQAQHCTKCSGNLEELALWSWRDDTEASNETTAEEARPKDRTTDQS